MKLHRNLVFATIDSLHQIFNEKKQADKVLRSTLKRDKRWGSRDRSFIAETTYDIVRWKRLYSEIAEVKEPYDRSNLFRLFTVWATLNGIAIPDWPQFEATPTRRIKGRFDELSKIRKMRELTLLKQTSQSCNLSFLKMKLKPKPLKDTHML